MTALEIALRLVAGVLLVGVNAFFVTTEFALTRLPQLGRDACSGDPRLERAWAMTEELEIYLTGCQLGISASSVVLGIVAEPAVTWALRPLIAWAPLGDVAERGVAVVVGVVLIQLVHKIWGEQAPTYLGVERPLQVARVAAPVHYVFTRVAYPLIKAGDGLAKATLRLFGVEVTRSWTEAEVAEPEATDADAGSPRERVARALAGAAMPADRKREVERAAAIDELPAGAIATPREEVRWVDEADGVDGLIALLRDRPTVRVPLVSGDLDGCVGVLHVPAVLAEVDALRRGETSLRELAVDALELPAETPVSRAIDRFQDAQRELAVLRDDDARAVGILTVTDCFEAIVGELEDPFDLRVGAAPS